MTVSVPKSGFQAGERVLSEASVFYETPSIDRAINKHGDHMASTTNNQGNPPRRSSILSATNLRRRRNADVLRRMRIGDPLQDLDARQTWFPPRPLIKKDPEAIFRLYNGLEQAGQETIPQKTS
jgi:hypothetical protein